MTRSRRPSALLIGSIVLVCASLTLPLVARGDQGRSKIGCAGGGDTSDLRAGRGTIAVSGSGLTVVGEEPDCLYHRELPDETLLRHVFAKPGAGTVYVADDLGGDEVVVLDESGRRTIPTGAEATHPTLSRSGKVAWATDMRALVVDAGTAPERVARPRSTTAVFSPVFADDHSIVAVLQAGATGTRMSEDETVNDLWRFDLYRERWERLTHFRTEGSEWSAIRTPVVLPNGELLFVRVHGVATSTRAPVFELWSLEDERARKLARLPGEMYLAGLHDGRVAWNVFSKECGDWELLVEGRRGLEHLACGAVAVDPVTVADPDLSAEGVESAGDGAGPESDAQRIGVVIGDFATRQEAEAVAARAGKSAEVVTAVTAPLAVRPGAFAVVVAPGRADQATLRLVRDRIGGLGSKAYLAPVGG